MKNLRIDIVSDVVCPWCIIGFKRLEAALVQLKDEVNADIHWHPFELNPHMPEDGENLRSHLAAKYGTTLEGSIAARKRLTDLGAELGFTFNYFDDMRMFNTRRAHQLLHWARDSGKQTALKMCLFEAFFSLQKALNDDMVLLDAAEQAGLDRTAAAEALQSQALAQEVLAEQREFQRMGIQAVPAYIFDQQSYVSGAQEPQVLVDVIGNLLKEKARV